MGEEEETRRGEERLGRERDKGVEGGEGGKRERDRMGKEKGEREGRKRRRKVRIICGLQWY